VGPNVSSSCHCPLASNSNRTSQFPAPLLIVGKLRPAGELNLPFRRLSFRRLCGRVHTHEADRRPLRSSLKVVANFVVVQRRVGTALACTVNLLCGIRQGIPQTIIGMWKGGGVSSGLWKTCMVDTQLVSLPTHVTKQYGLAGPFGSASATPRLISASRSCAHWRCG
jgi:hypothetical protein